MVVNQHKFNIELRPSRYFFTLISGLHLILVFILCLSDFPWWSLIILLIIVLLSYFYVILKYVYRRSKYNVVNLRQHEGNSDPHVWLLKFRNQKVKSARLKPKGYISSYFIIMHFEIITDNKSLSKLSSIRFLKRLKYKNIPVIIFPDMLDYSYYLALKRFLLGY